MPERLGRSAHGSSCRRLRRVRFLEECGKRIVLCYRRWTRAPRRYYRRSRRPRFGSALLTYEPFAESGIRCDGTRHYIGCALVIAFRKNLSACLGRKFCYLLQKRLHLEGFRPRQEVDQDWAACGDFTGMERLDAVVSNEIGQIVGTVEAHAASKSPQCRADFHNTRPKSASRGAGSRRGDTW